MASINEQLNNLPPQPGTYLFKNETGNILYVGKAKSLRTRVRSYFRKNADLDPAKRNMIKKIHDIETIVTDTETEALVLEASLIKKHQPPYNVILRDDKFYLFIKIVRDNDTIRAFPVRRIKGDGARYFGPYSSARAVRETLKLLRRIFPAVRDEKDHPRELTFPHPLFSDQKISAGGSMKRPPDERNSEGPHQSEAKVGEAELTGVGRGSSRQDPSEHADAESQSETIQQVVTFLKGDRKLITETLRRGMREASKGKQYERAAIFRDQLQAIERLEGSQKVFLPNKETFDVISIATNQSRSAGNVFQIREGRLLNKNTFLLKHRTSTLPADILRQFLLQYYTQTQESPPVILIPHDLQDSQALSEFIDEKNPPHIAVPQRGKKRQLIEMGRLNANQLLQSELAAIETKKQIQQALQELAQALGIPTDSTKYPLHRVEIYDISNIQGKLATGSMVVFTDGHADKSQYRKFKIKIDGEPNDFAMLAEVLTRRFAKKNQSWKKPNLILIDGGKGQLSAAQSALQKMNVDLPIASLAKREETLFTLVSEDQQTTSSDTAKRSLRFDQDSLTERGRRSSPPEAGLAPTERVAGGSSLERSLKKVREINLPYDSPALFLIQRMRDEAHRFTITYHRLLRSKQSKRSLLDEIPGIGPKTKKQLLSHFGSLKRIRAAQESELITLIGKDKTRRLQDWL